MKINKKILAVVLTFVLFGSIIGAFPSVVYCDTQTELIVNGGFESGLNGWNVSGDFHADPGFSYSHSGTRYAYLSTATGNPGNNLVGNMYQTVSIPSSATSATLTFWYNITTDETGASPYDVLNVTIQNSAGSYLSTVASWSNLNKQPIGVYSQKIFDLTPYIGQVIRINFLGTTDGSLPTVFRIDDVIIATSTPPPTLSFTSLTPGTVSTSQSTHVETFSASGTNFNNVNQITVNWSGPDSGSQTWNKGDSNWNAAVTVNSDISMTLLIRVLSNETGTQTKTWTWTVTLKDTTNATASKSFIVTYIYKVEDEKVVFFPDPNLEAVIREAINKPTGDIYDTDLLTLTYINGDSKGISDLTGLEYCINLASLNLRYNQIGDISALEKLTSLTELSLGDNQISDISVLENLTSLTRLSLYFNQISDISALENLTSLTELDLQYNQISDVSALENLTSLTRLVLNSNQISDISALENLTSLTGLFLGNNQIADISILENFTSLMQLSLGNQISDISVLGNLTSLTYLYLHSNNISDISALANLTSLTWLYLGDNQISDILALENLTNLTLLDLDNNQISDISALENLTNLTELLLYFNRISDISMIVANPGIDSGDEVDLLNNPLSHESLDSYIPQLRARGVIVYYDESSHETVSQPQVIVTPNSTGANAMYTIQFDTTLPLAAVDTITITFPPETSLIGVSSPSGHIVNAGVSNDGGISLVVPALVTQNMVVIGIPDEKTTAGPAHMVVTISSNVFNPTVPSDYTLWVNTSQETIPVESAPYAITIPGVLIADFIGSPTQGTTPLPVKFTDKSTGSITSWFWDFGDGVNSTEQNPSHIYNIPGTYSVSFTVSGPGGSNTTTKNDYISVSNQPKTLRDIILEDTLQRIPVTVEEQDYSIIILKDRIDPETLQMSSLGIWKVYIDSNSNPVTDARLARKIGLIDYALQQQSAFQNEYARLSTIGDGLNQLQTDKNRLDQLLEALEVAKAAQKIVEIQALSLEIIDVQEQILVVTQQIGDALSLSASYSLNVDIIKQKLMLVKLNSNELVNFALPKTITWLQEKYIYDPQKEANNDFNSYFNAAMSIYQSANQILNDSDISEYTTASNFIQSYLAGQPNAQAALYLQTQLFDNTAQVFNWLKDQIIDGLFQAATGINALPLLRIVNDAFKGLDWTFNSLYEFELNDSLNRCDLKYELFEASVSYVDYTLKFSNPSGIQDYRQSWIDSHSYAYSQASDTYKENVNYLPFANQIGWLMDHIDKFGFTEAAKRWIDRIFSPGELRVYDIEGRITGIVNGNIIEEIPNSFYIEETIVILSPEKTNYTLVVGTGKGSYGLSIDMYDNDILNSVVATNIPISPNTIHLYSIDWNALSQGQAGVTIQIDSDDDGIFEDTIVTSPPYVPGEPSPFDGATGISTDSTLGWTGGDPDLGENVTYKVYMGTSQNPPLASDNLIANTYDPGTLEYDTTYYWRVVARDNHGISTEGPIWSFATFSAPAPPGGGGGGIGGGSSGVAGSKTILTEYTTAEGEFLYDAAAQSLDSLVTLYFPEGTTAKNKYGQPLRSITIEEETTPPEPSAECQFVCLTYDIGPNQATFDPPAFLSFQYSESQIPDGVAEENLVFATWQDGKWVELEGCTINTVDNIITVPISHLTIFTVMAGTTPARFEVTALTVTPAELQSYAPVTVSVTVTNTGDLTGKYTVILKLNNIDNQNKEITLKGGESRTVNFSVTQTAAGTYTVNIGGLSGKFTIKEPEPEGAVAEIPAPEPPSPSSTQEAPALSAEQPVATVQPEPESESPIESPIEPTPSQGMAWWLIGIFAACGIIVISLPIYIVIRKRIS